MIINGKKIICCNQTFLRNDGEDNLYSCSRNGQMVTEGCCIECLTISTETEEEKIQRQINLNNRLIEYHQKELGSIRKAQLELSKRLSSINTKCTDSNSV